MGQQNTMYNGPMRDSELEQIHSYSGITCFPQPYNNRTILPIRPTFDPRYLPENHGQLPYMITQYHGGEHCNTFIMPSPNPGVFRVPVDSNNHQMFERNRNAFMEGPNAAFKRHMVNGFDHVMVHGGQPGQTVLPPWFDQRSASGVYSLNHAHGIPYPQGRINGGGMEGGNIGIHAYQVAAFMHPPPITPHLYHPPPPPPPPPPPMPPVQTNHQNLDLRLHLASTSNLHSTTANLYQNGVDLPPRFSGPTPPIAFMVPENRRREMVVETSRRHHSYHHLRVLPEDELLALGEQIGNVETGLSDNLIFESLKTKMFVSLRSSAMEDQMPADEEPNFCVICQMEFENEEKIGVLDCCHEYHAECIQKWLNVKNNCPICKSIGLARILP